MVARDMQGAQHTDGRPADDQIVLGDLLQSRGDQAGGCADCGMRG